MFDNSVICGVVRNGGQGFQETLERLIQFESQTLSTNFIIVTNDNDDHTGETLESWSANNPRRILINLDGLKDFYQNKIDRLCVARNYYLERIRSIKKNRRLDYVIVMDLDGPNVNFNIENLTFALNSFSIRDWSAIFANQSEGYYDLYALRHSEWCPDDCWSHMERQYFRRIIDGGRDAQMQKYIFSKQYIIDIDHAPIQVTSAFGGLGIYRAEAINGSWYATKPLGRKSKKRICEHVLFNESIHHRYGGLYIQPRLLNVAPDEHYGSQHRTAFPF